jgi:hypothetical protein
MVAPAVVSQRTLRYVLQCPNERQVINSGCAATIPTMVKNFEHISQKIIRKKIEKKWGRKLKKMFCRIVKPNRIYFRTIIFSVFLGA